jgi:secreted trypsin-like serine protease
MYKVYLGVHDKHDILNPQKPVVEKTIWKYVIHPDFNSDSVLNDIAILKLTEPVELSKYIQVACLPVPQSSFYPDPGMTALAAGWGVTSFGGEQPRSLRNVRLNIFEGEMCNDIFPETPKNWDTQICGGVLEGGIDTCQGDSGGAIYTLEIVDGVSKYIASGIVSYGKGCGLQNTPA